MKLTHGLAALVLLASASAAHAEFSGTAAAVTDYNWRGVTQTAQGPAVQGSLDYSHSSGFYAGLWGSNVDFGDCCDESVEVDIYAGFSGGEELVWDVGINYYSYPGADDLDFGEIYASLGYKWIEGKIWYSDDFGNYGKSAMYYEANAAFELPYNLGLAGHLGYSDGSGIEEAYGQGDYIDWSIGLTYTYNHFDFGLKWVDGSDLKTYDGTPDDVLSSESRAIFSISTAFPWTSGEE
jgi:uncharacterized protein (TIGR02001 family)